MFSVNMLFGFLEIAGFPPVICLAFFLGIIGGILLVIVGVRYGGISNALKLHYKILVAIIVVFLLIISSLAIKMTTGNLSHKEQAKQSQYRAAVVSEALRKLELIVRQLKEDHRNKQLDNEQAIQNLKSKYVQELANAHTSMNAADIAALKERQAMEIKNLEVKQSNTEFVNKTLVEIQIEKAILEMQNEALGKGVEIDRKEFDKVYKK
jgi:ABC-type transport system involved in cytochrome bd biosynthesis fused ATPase/permease subunit